MSSTYSDGLQFVVIRLVEILSTDFSNHVLSFWQAHLIDLSLRIFAQSSTTPTTRFGSTTNTNPATSWATSITDLQLPRH